MTKILCIFKVTVLYENVKIRLINPNFCLWLLILLLLDMETFKRRKYASSLFPYIYIYIYILFPYIYIYIYILFPYIYITQHFDNYFAPACLFYDCIKNLLDAMKAQNQHIIVCLNMFHGFNTKNVNFSFDNRLIQCNDSSIFLKR